MSEAQPEQTNSTPTVQHSTPTKSGGIFNSWKVKAGLIATLLVSAFLAIFLLVFYWQHLVAGMGMKSWASHAGAIPIECMIKDTNSDGYVSCSAMLMGEVVPLECGANIFNIGCRVSYGSAVAPPIRQSQGASRF